MVDFRPSTTLPSLLEKFLYAPMPSAVGVMRRSPQNVSAVHQSITIDIMPTPAEDHTEWHAVSTFHPVTIDHDLRGQPYIEVYLPNNSVAIEVSSRPKLTGIVRGKAFLHVLRRRSIGYPDSRKRTR
ncbi:hypothetical protein TNCV_1186311 [Trichonephila clavipes]|nr:hypothetical protein TNCV_1186311 [Trichonephila clavipes]